MAFFCCTLAMAAQNDIRVNYQGDKPTIMDFAWAFLFSDDDDEDECDSEATAGIKQALTAYRQGQPQDEHASLTVDQKNGYILYEWKYDENVVRTEMCFWNESDGKHKLFAYSSWYYSNGKPILGQYDTLTFMRYNNATKKMSACETPGFDVEYGTEDGAWVSYALPSAGKDITVTYWYKNDETKQKTLKWNGRRFSY